MRREANPAIFSALWKEKSECAKGPRSLESCAEVNFRQKNVLLHLGLCGSLGSRLPLKCVRACVCVCVCGSGRLEREEKAVQSGQEKGGLEQLCKRTKIVWPAEDAGKRCIPPLPVHPVLHTLETQHPLQCLPVYSTQNTPERSSIVQTVIFNTEKTVAACFLEKDSTV